MRRNGAVSGPTTVYQFPGVSCISVNDEIVHGIPSNRRLRNGDLLKLDVTISKDGFMADAAETVIVGPPTTESSIGNRLAVCAQRAFHEAMQVARAGHRVRDIGRVVEKEVNASGFHVIRDLCGHGIGRTIHEKPSVPNWPDPFRLRHSDRRPGHHGRAHHRQPLREIGAGQRRLDRPHRRPRPRRPLRAHHRDHQE